MLWLQVPPFWQFSKQAGPVPDKLLSVLQLGPVPGMEDKINKCMSMKSDTIFIFSISSFICTFVSGIYLTKLFKPAESLLGLSLILNSKGFLDLQRATFPQASHVTHIFGRICPSIQPGSCRWRAQYTGPRADKGGDMLHPHTEILRPSGGTLEHHEEH